LFEPNIDARPEQLRQTMARPGNHALNETVGCASETRLTHPTRDVESPVACVSTTRLTHAMSDLPEIRRHAVTAGPARRGWSGQFGWLPPWRTIRGGR
jgi:hypothetical protein